MNNSPIGIFDSGVGGLSVWKELIKILPNESMLYYADSANCPYGEKSKNEIINLSKRIVEYFISQNVKLIVVACNTATASAIDFLRENYSIPFIGMEPAIKPAALNTKKGTVGILATEGTLEGELFLKTTKEWASDINVEVVVGKGFVELVEAGDFSSEKSKEIVSNVISPLLDKGIDQLVLACTHYPFLCDNIKRLTKKKKLNIINPAPAIANQTKKILTEEHILSSHETPYYKFISSGNLDTLKLLVTEIDPKITNNTFNKISLYSN